MGWLKRQVTIFIATYNRWSQHDGSAMAAAVAYYVALSFFPLLLTLIAGIGLFFKFANSGQDAERAVLLLVQEHVASSAGTAVEQTLKQVRDTSILHGPVALFAMFISSMASFVQLQQSFDRVTGAPANQKKGIIGAIRMVLTERFVAFVMLGALGLLVTALFIGSIVLSATESYAVGSVPGWWILRRPVRIFVGFCVNTALFTLIYRWLPKIPASLNASFRGAIVAAIIWEIGRQILAELLIGTKYTTAYGVLGSFIGLMLWCYYGVAVLLLGAEYIQVICDRPSPSGK